MQTKDKTVCGVCFSPPKLKRFCELSQKSSPVKLKKCQVDTASNSEDLLMGHDVIIEDLQDILDIFQINTLDIAKFMFHYHNNLLPPLFLNLFMTNSQVHKYDARTAGNYCVHPCCRNVKKFTILYQGPRVWNCLPASTTNLSSFPMFKSKVLEFLLK